MPGAKSRRLRSGRRARRAQQRILIAGTGALALALTSTLSIASFSGVDIASAAVAKAQSLADMFARRSPGERTTAHLTKTKHKHKHFAVLAAREEAEIPAPPVEKPLVEALLTPAPATLPVIPVALPAIAEKAAPPIAPAVFAPVIGGGIFAPGGGGGGPGGGGGGPPGQPPPNQPPGQPPPTPSVPEPGTWAMMIAGFGLSGLMLRRRHRADRRPLAA